MVAGNGRRAIGQDVVQRLHHMIGWQAARARAKIHRPSTRVKTQSHLGGRGDLGAEQVAALAREHVVMIRRGGAAGTGQRGETAGRRDPHRFLVDACPDRIERGEPLEQRVVRGETPGDPLVEVVVGVHQARCQQTAAAVDALDLAVEGGCVALADGLDPVAAQHHMAAAVLGADRVDGRDSAAIDDRH